MSNNQSENNTEATESRKEDNIICKVLVMQVAKKIFIPNFNKLIFPTL